ncbi:unnamed protein product, partial [Rotaria sp. Silwood2]
MREDIIPVGRPLSNSRCIIYDEFEQTVFVGQEGELFVGGGGHFAGYLNRDDLTVKALVKINGKLYYRTGDIVRMDSNGLINYIGRKDHQMKIHGQRIEAGEIERCLLETHITACVVVKFGDDHLVAYVQCSNIDEEVLRKYCRSRLPPFMVPSHFIVLNRLPLNANGKVDRKRLPIPDFLASSVSTTSKFTLPKTEMEERVHDLWREVLKTGDKRISTVTGFFSAGGHSLLFIKLYHHYQSIFNFDSHMLSITPFLQQATIIEHAKLLESIKLMHVKPKEWHSLHITEDAIIEQQILMSAASSFWLDSLRDFKIDQCLHLPFDRRRLSDEHRTGRGISASFNFNEDLSKTFLSIVSMYKTKPEYLALAIYYAFLFKLTNGDRDLCIVTNVHGRYKPELMSIIGMFANVIPLRCKFDPHWSFTQLLEEVQQMASDSLEHSYFPLQRILAQHSQTSKPAFLDTSFQFDSNTVQNIFTNVNIGDACLCFAPHSFKIGTDEIAS